MRMHIGLIICHFLLSTVSITESPKNKIMGKSGLYGLYPCRGSPVKQFLFYRVSRKIAYFFSYKGFQKIAFFAIFLDIL